MRGVGGLNLAAERLMVLFPQLVFSCARVTLSNVLKGFGLAAESSPSEITRMLTLFDSHHRKHSDKQSTWIRSSLFIGRFVNRKIYLWETDLLFTRKTTDTRVLHDAPPPPPSNKKRQEGVNTGGEKHIWSSFIKLQQLFLDLLCGNI